MFVSQLLAQSSGVQSWCKGHGRNSAVKPNFILMQHWKKTNWKSSENNRAWGQQLCMSLQMHAYLSVSPLSLCVDGAVALGVLARRFRLRWVPLEGAAELEALVLRWHGDAEPREALGVQVSLHARRHAVGALETSPPANTGSHSRPAAIRWHSASHAQAFVKLHSPLITVHSHCGGDSRDVSAVTTTHTAAISPVKSSGIWHTSVCKCHVCGPGDICLPCFKFSTPPPVIVLRCLMRCESHFRCHTPVLPPLPGRHTLTLDDYKKRWRLLTGAWSHTAQRGLGVCSVVTARLVCVRFWPMSNAGYNKENGLNRIRKSRWFDLMSHGWGWKMRHIWNKLSLGSSCDVWWNVKWSHKNQLRNQPKVAAPLGAQEAKALTELNINAIHINYSAKAEKLWCEVAQFCGEASLANWQN